MLARIDFQGFAILFFKQKKILTVDDISSLCSTLVASHNQFGIVVNRFTFSPHIL